MMIEKIALRCAVLTVAFVATPICHGETNNKDDAPVRVLQRKGRRCISPWIIYKDAYLPVQYFPRQDSLKRLSPA